MLSHIALTNPMENPRGGGGGRGGGGRGGGGRGGGGRGGGGRGPGRGPGRGGHGRGGRGRRGWWGGGWSPLVYGYPYYYPPVNYGNCYDPYYGWYDCAAPPYSSAPYPYYNPSSGHAQHTGALAMGNLARPDPRATFEQLTSAMTGHFPAALNPGCPPHRLQQGVVCQIPRHYYGTGPLQYAYYGMSPSAPYYDPVSPEIRAAMHHNPPRDRAREVYQRSLSAA